MRSLLPPYHPEKKNNNNNKNITSSTLNILIVNCRSFNAFHNENAVLFLCHHKDTHSPTAPIGPGLSPNGPAGPGHNLIGHTSLTVSPIGPTDPGLSPTGPTGPGLSPTVHSLTGHAGSGPTGPTGSALSLDLPDKVGDDEELHDAVDDANGPALHHHGLGGLVGEEVGDAGPHDGERERRIAGRGRG